MLALPQSVRVLQHKEAFSRVDNISQSPWSKTAVVAETAIEFGTNEGRSYEVDTCTLNMQANPPRYVTSQRLWDGRRFD